MAQVNNVLEPYQQMEIAKLLAWFWGQSEIVRYVDKEFGKKITKQAIDNYKNSNKWQPVIDKYRDEYRKAIFDVPLANKRKRLDELQKAYDYYTARDMKEKALKVLVLFREEMEKKFGDVSFSFTQVTNNEFNGMTDEQIMEEKSKTLESLEKIRKLKLLVDYGKMKSEDEDAIRGKDAQEK